MIADLVPKGYAELIMAVPTMGRLETFPYSTVQGLQAGRKLSFGDFPVFPAAGDLDGDGNIDLATIDADGKWIRYRYATDSNLFVRETTPAPPSGTTCASVFIVGQGKFNNDSAVDVATLACPSMTSPITFGALHVFLGGSTPSAPWVSTHGHIRDATVADVDRDGLLDVLFVTSQSPTLYILKSTGTALTESSNTELPFMPDKISAGDLDDDGDTDLVLVLNSTLKVMENTGLGFSENSSFDSNLPRALLLQDLDGDNRLDVAWLSGNKIQIRRNQGGFTFSSYELDTENSLAVSLSAGDLEGDGDMDLAATYNPLEQQTRTYVWVNKAY